MKTLRQLAGVVSLPATFLENGTGFDPADYTEELPGREIDSAPLINLVSEAMRRFNDNREASDAWLAPRLHWVLRLTRREAARRGLWAWLAVVAVPEYVRWRFPGKEGATEVGRYLGREDKNAVGRLWWGAELMRNGEDYAPVGVGFSMQDVPNTWMRLNAFHNRALVQASLRFLGDFNKGQAATSDQVNLVAKAVNTAARTVLLDAIAPDPEFDRYTLEAWLDGGDGLDETDVFNGVPVGPLEERVPEGSVDAMVEFISSVSPSPVRVDGGDSEGVAT